MHTMWKGSISFGLVNIPVKMFTATEDKDIRFRSLHNECHTPIKYSKTCPHCEKEVNNTDIVKGYEYEPGKYVVIKEDDLESIQPASSKNVEIVDFVHLSDIDPIYFDRSYYLAPQDNGEKAYALLRKSMADTGKIGIAKITIRSKQSLAVIRVFEECLLLETIYFPDEVRNVGLVPGLPQNVNLNDKEINMANQLIDQLTAPFEPEKYNDEYRADLFELIQKKLEGQEVVEGKPVEQKGNIIDLMQALQASLEATSEKPEKKKAKAAIKPKAVKRERKKEAT